MLHSFMGLVLVLALMITAESLKLSRPRTSRGSRISPANCGSERYLHNVPDAYLVVDKDDVEAGKQVFHQVLRPEAHGKSPLWQF
jgi:hypothetical protein